jgi:plasmid stabilization system protein ParE
MSAVLMSVPSARTAAEMVADWIAAKRDESAANDRRVAIEAEIIAALGEPDEGSATHTLDDGAKLTITSKVTRSVDGAVWKQVMDRVPEALRPITFEETPRLDTKGLRWLMENQPAVYQVVAMAITAKKAKSAISVKVA